MARHGEVRGEARSQGTKAALCRKPHPKEAAFCRKNLPPQRGFVPSCSQPCPSLVIFLSPHLSILQSTMMPNQCTGESEIRNRKGTKIPPRPRDVSIYHKHGTRHTSLSPQQRGCPAFLSATALLCHLGLSGALSPLGGVPWVCSG